MGRPEELHRLFIGVCVNAARRDTEDAGLLADEFDNFAPSDLLTCALTEATDAMGILADARGTEPLRAWEWWRNERRPVVASYITTEETRQMLGSLIRMVVAYEQGEHDKASEIAVADVPPERVAYVLSAAVFVVADVAHLVAEERGTDPIAELQAWAMTATMGEAGMFDEEA